MIKRTLYFIIFFLIISLVYLNYFGISTNKFNKKIESTIKEKYPNISIRLKDVRVLFDKRDYSRFYYVVEPIINKSGNKKSNNYS